MVYVNGIYNVNRHLYRTQPSPFFIRQHLKVDFSAVIREVLRIIVHLLFIPIISNIIYRAVVSSHIFEESVASMLL